MPYHGNSVTLWLALDDADAGNGGLTYAVGSHEWNVELEGNGARKRVTDDERTFMGGTSDTFSTPVSLAASNNGVEDLEGILVTPNVTAGGGLLHNQDTWHGSGVNGSVDRHRRAIAIHYVDGECKWRPSESKLPWGEVSEDEERRTGGAGETTKLYATTVCYYNTTTNNLLIVALLLAIPRPNPFLHRTASLILV